MSWIDALRATVRPFVRRGRADREMSAELAFHLEREREKNLAAGIASLWLTRYVEWQLYGVSRLDPLSYVVVSLFLLSIALLASYLPARRASRVSPMTALRVD